MCLRGPTRLLQASGEVQTEWPARLGHESTQQGMRPPPPPWAPRDPWAPGLQLYYGV